MSTITLSSSNHPCIKNIKYYEDLLLLFYFKFFMVLKQTKQDQTSCELLNAVVDVEYKKGKMRIRSTLLHKQKNEYTIYINDIYLSRRKLGFVLRRNPIYL